MADVAKSRGQRLPHYVLAYYPEDGTKCIVKKERVVDHKPLHEFMRNPIHPTDTRSGTWIKTKFLISGKKEEEFSGLLILKF